MLPSLYFLLPICCFSLKVQDGSLQNSMICCSFVCTPTGTHTAIKQAGAREGHNSVTAQLCSRNQWNYQGGKQNKLKFQMKNELSLAGVPSCN